MFDKFNGVTILINNSSNILSHTLLILDGCNSIEVVISKGYNLFVIISRDYRSSYFVNISNRSIICGVIHINLFDDN